MAARSSNGSDFVLTRKSAVARSFYTGSRKVKGDTGLSGVPIVNAVEADAYIFRNISVSG